jgi:tetratricopeptide (TPR) repeat protein
MPKGASSGPETEAGETGPATPPEAAQTMTTRMARLNERAGLLLSVSTKLVVTLGGFVFLGLILTEIFRSDTFTIGRLDVPDQFRDSGYTGELIARQIAFEMRSRVARVPAKLEKMFTTGSLDPEERDRIEQSIAQEYNDRKDEINISLSLGMIDLPIDKLLAYLRRTLGVDSRTVESGITIQDTKLSMSVALLTNGQPATFETFSREYDSERPDSIYDALDDLISRTADFILETNHPIVMVLQDYEYKPEYSAGDSSWAGDEQGIYPESRRIEILEQAIEDPPNDNDEIRKWAHAVLGHIQMERKDEDGLKNYKKALEVDPKLVEILGPTLVFEFCLEDATTWDGCQEAIGVLDRMLEIDPDDGHALGRKREALKDQVRILDDEENPDPEQFAETVNSYMKLLDQSGRRCEDKRLAYSGLAFTYAAWGKDEALFENMELARRHGGLDIQESDLDWSPWDRYRNRARFEELRRTSEEDIDRRCIREKKKS